MIRNLQLREKKEKQCKNSEITQLVQSQENVTIITQFIKYHSISITADQTHAQIKVLLCRKSQMLRRNTSKVALFDMANVRMRGLRYIDSTGVRVIQSRYMCHLPHRVKRDREKYSQSPTTSVSVRSSTRILRSSLLTLR